MNPLVERKGAIRAADIPPGVLQALERGELQTATLVECLAMNQARLMRSAFPDLDSRAFLEAEAAGTLGILKRMARMAEILLDHLGPAGIDRCQSHASDTVRGWACFMVAAQDDINLSQCLARIQSLADDPHFGVREWAWIAVRPHLADELADSIALLSRWTTSHSERLRRFACEALRPRGVWCAHIPALKKNPELALPLLEPLHADISIYVQDSVSNWLNDAAKDQPEWVVALCERWMHGDPPAETRRICKRALRSIRQTMPSRRTS